jgi:hypothetical protein
MIDADAAYEEACDERDEAWRILSGIRENARVFLNAHPNTAGVVKFNNGNPVLLCHLCRTILRNVDRGEHAAEICAPGYGCGSHEPVK